MTAVDFLRHGETEAPEVLLGRTDAPLAPNGRAAVARQTQGRAWAAIVASPAARTQASAEIAAGGRTIETDADWREIDFGDWDGRPRREIAGETRLGAFYADPEANPPPNGETMGAVRQRVAAALGRIAARGDGPVLVVAHGGSIRMALSVLLAIPFARLWAIRIACATRIRVELGADPAQGLWGEIVEIVQPPPDGEGR